jgi:hypothetical protein
MMTSPPHLACQLLITSSSTSAAGSVAPAEEGDVRRSNGATNEDPHQQLIIADDKAVANVVPPLSLSVSGW